MNGGKDWSDFATQEEVTAIKGAVNELAALHGKMAFQLQVIESYARLLSRRMVEAEQRLRSLPAPAPEPPALEGQGHEQG